jgi:hypothetical protein
MKTNGRERTTGYNTGLAKVALQCSASTFVVKIANFLKLQNVSGNPMTKAEPLTKKVRI